jgi:hydroxyacylglutathione hydrolase
LTSTLLRTTFISIAAAILLLAAASCFAPYLYAEYAFDWGAHAPKPLAKPVAHVTGHWFDDYFLVETLDPTTFAIGEPLYYQGNYSYLILGSHRAVLFDAGTGLRDITPVVRSITSLPVTVISSHLHFDHVGGLGRFDKTAVLDDPTLLERAASSSLTLERYEFLGFADRLKTPTFRVDEWWKPGSTVELGSRTLHVMATPGHTPTSVSLYDADRHQLFSGDFIYPGELYAFLPGASRSAYLATTRYLLTAIDPKTQIFAAHMQESPAPVKAPVLGTKDLLALQSALIAIDEGRAASRGFYPRSFLVKDGITFATGWAWNNR